MEIDRLVATKRWLIETALRYLGTPYIWGGDDPSGFDCSGFVLELLKTVGIVKEKDDYTADGMLKLFANRVVDRPVDCGLLFWIDEKGKATHVVFCLDSYFYIGAGGGGSADQTPQQAWKDNAYVKIRPINFDQKQHRCVALLSEAA